MKVGFREKEFNSFPIVKGRERVLIIGMNEKRRSIFAICELESIIASHNEKTFSSSLDYPTDEKGRNVNDRNYAKDKNAQAKVKSVAQNLEPNMLVSTSPNPSGTPIISLDGIVVSGNNRVMSLKLAQSDYPEVYNKYHKVLVNEIGYGGYGIKSSDFLDGKTYKPKFKYPVLVRIDLDFKEYNSTELNKYNVVREKSEKQIDKSIRISQLLQKNEGCKNKLIDLINEQEVVSELYNNQNSVARFKAILLECGLITENDISALFTTTSLSEQGKIMYNTILLSLVLNENSLEISQNDGIKGYTRNVVNAILPLIKNKSLSKGSLIDYVNDSFLIQNDLVNGGFKHLNDYIKQNKLGFEEESNEFKNKNALIINEVVNSGFSKLKNVLTKYNSSMEQNIEPDMFGEQLSEEEIFNKTFGVEVDEKTVSLIDKLGGNKIKGLENTMNVEVNKYVGRKGVDDSILVVKDIDKDITFNVHFSSDYGYSQPYGISFPSDINIRFFNSNKNAEPIYNKYKSYIDEFIISLNTKTKEIFNPNGYGENLNELFNEWNVAKTEADYNNWKEKVCKSFVGTYQNEMLSDKVDNFILDKHKDSFQFKSFKKELENAYKWCFKKYDKKEIYDLNRPQELTGQSFENLVHSVQGESFQYTEKMYPNKKAVGFIRITGTPIDRLGGATTVPKEEAFVGNIITLDNGEKAKILYVRKSNKELLEESGYYEDDEVVEEVKPKSKSKKQPTVVENKLNLLNLMMKSAKGSAKELIEKKIKVLNLMNK